jgi:hypothetical protein
MIPSSVTLRISHLSMSPPPSSTTKPYCPAVTLTSTASSATASDTASPAANPALSVHFSTRSRPPDARSAGSSADLRASPRNVTSPRVALTAGPPAAEASISVSPVSDDAASVIRRPSRRTASSYTPGAIEITAASGATSSASWIVG